MKYHVLQRRAGTAEQMVRAAPVKLTPLTPKEQAFAEENHDIILKFLNSSRIDTGDNYGLVSLGYLQAVKKWFARPDLHQHAFGAIAWMTMRSCLGNEYRRQDTALKTVSLDAAVPGTDDLTLSQVITYKNLNYIEREGKGLKISYDVKIPEAARTSRTPNLEVELILEFLAGKNKNLCLEYDTKEEATKRGGVIRSFRKNHKHTDFEIYRMDCRIYIERIKEQKGKQS